MAISWIARAGEQKGRASFSDGDDVAPDAVYIDLDAITVDEEDDFKGLAPGDVLAALRDVIAAETSAGIRGAINGALGRVD